MTRRLAAYGRSQDGYTLVEVIIASAIGLMVMTGLTSIILTSVKAVNTATGRVEASSQIRSFQYFAHDDFARSSPPPGDGCGAAPWTCPIVLTGTQVSNSTTPAAYSYQVTYSWNQANQTLDRQVGSSSPIHAATDVSAFSWYLDSSAAKLTVVVSLTVTVLGYSESQTMRFYPQLN